MVLVSFSSKELVRKLDERRAVEDSYCSFEALELGFAALQSDRDGAEVGRQYGVHGGAQKRLWAEDHRLHGEHLQQGASERFCARVFVVVVERRCTPPQWAGGTSGGLPARQLVLFQGCPHVTHTRAQRARQRFWTLRPGIELFELQCPPGRPRA